MTQLQPANLSTPWTDELRRRAPTFMASVGKSSQKPSAVEIANQKAEEKKQQTERDIRRFVDEQVGQRYETATLNSYEPVTESQKRALEAIVAHSTGINAFEENVVLYGPCGSGKDHLLIGLGKKAIAFGRPVKWVFGVDLFRTMRDVIGSKSSETELVASLVAPAILILSDPAPPDDAATVYQRSVLLSVLDQRYRHCKPTWSTINATNKVEAIERLGGQTIDRIWTDASHVFVNGPSYRSKYQ